MTQIRITPFKELLEYRSQKKTWSEISEITGEKAGALRTRFSRQKAALKGEVKSKVSVSSYVDEETEEVNDVVMIDTREMDNFSWARFYLNKYILHYQIEVFEAIEEGLVIIVIARQHGKTSFILLTLILRTLCETIYIEDGEPDRNVLYISTGDNANAMFSAVKFELLTNDAIINTYGHLIDREVIKGLRKYPQGHHTLRLTTLKNPSLISFMTTTPGSSLRGKNFYLVIVDDAIDFKEIRDKPGRTTRITNELLDTINKKIIPFVKGTLVVCGTRYAKQDIYNVLHEQGQFRLKEYPAIIGQVPEYTIPEHRPYKPEDIIVHEGDYKLLAPELWAKIPHSKFLSGSPIQNILFKASIMKEIDFQQEYMNNPTDRKGVLDWTKLGTYVVLPSPARSMKWVIFVDPASGKTAHSDVTSIVCIGYFDNFYYIDDIIYGRWTGKEKQTKLVDFYKLKLEKTNLAQIPILLEVVRNQDFYNRLRYESNLKVRPTNPKNRGEKIERIINNFATDLDNNMIFINEHCRNKNRLKEEMDSFPNLHPDVVDGIDQGMFFLTVRTKEIKPAWTA